MLIGFVLKHWRALTLAGLLIVGAWVLLAWDAQRIQAVQTAAYAAGQADVREQWDQERIEQQALALLAEQQARDEEQRRITEQRAQDEIDAKKLADARAAAARSDAVARRMLDRAAELEAAARSCPTGDDPAAATEREAADTAARMLAELRAELERRARIVARFGDEARAAGQSCERRYDSLTQ